MMFDLLSAKVLEITRQRLLGLTLTEIARDNPELQLLDTESQLNYGDQGTSYYFDYALGDCDAIRGIEGAISQDTFKMCEYTQISGSNVFKLDIRKLPSKMGEDEFFQYSLVEDIGALTVEQLRAILEIRDIIREGKIDWGVK